MFKTKKPTIIYYCEKCGKWRGSSKACPECKSECVKKELPKARGDYYFIKGIDKPLDRVTKIIDVLAKPALRYWAATQAARAMAENPTLSINEAATAMYRTRDKAGMRGSDVHNIIENIAKGGEVDEEAISKIPQVQAYRKFCGTMPHKMILCEEIVYSKKYGYAGKLDGVIQTKDGKNYLIDWKTSKGVYPETAIQLSAYKQALSELKPEIKIDGMAVIHLPADGSFSFIEMQNCFEIFSCALKIFNWKNKQ